MKSDAFKVPGTQAEAGRILSDWQLGSVWQREPLEFGRQSRAWASKVQDFFK